MPRYVLFALEFGCGIGRGRVRANPDPPTPNLELRNKHLLTYSFFLPLQAEKMNPIHGISKPGYEGKGFVQSPPLEKQ